MLKCTSILGAVIECKQYSEITLESGTPVKIVRIMYIEYICSGVWMWMMKLKSLMFSKRQGGSQCYNVCKVSSRRCSK